MKLSFLLRAILANLMPTKAAIVSFLKYMSAGAADFSNESVNLFLTQFKSYRANKELMTMPVTTDAELSQITEKTLLFLGDGEVLYDPHKAKKRVSSVNPSIEIAIIPGAKHTISVDKPKLFHQFLIDFCFNKNS